MHITKSTTPEGWLSAIQLFNVKVPDRAPDLCRRICSFVARTHNRLYNMPDAGRAYARTRIRCKVMERARKDGWHERWLAIVCCERELLKDGFVLISEKIYAYHRKQTPKSCC